MDREERLAFQWGKYDVYDEFMLNDISTQPLTDRMLENQTGFLDDELYAEGQLEALKEIVFGMLKGKITAADIKD